MKKGSFDNFSTQSVQPGLGPLAQEDHGAAGVDPEEDHKDDHRDQGVGLTMDAIASIL